MRAPIPKATARMMESSRQNDSPAMSTTGPWRRASPKSQSKTNMGVRAPIKTCAPKATKSATTVANQVEPEKWAGADM